MHVHLRKKRECLAAQEKNFPSWKREIYPAGNLVSKERESLLSMTILPHIKILLFSAEPRSRPVFAKHGGIELSNAHHIIENPRKLPAEHIDFYLKKKLLRLPMPHQLPHGRVPVRGLVDVGGELFDRRGHFFLPPQRFLYLIMFRKRISWTYYPRPPTGISAEKNLIGLRPAHLANIYLPGAETVPALESPLPPLLRIHVVELHRKESTTPPP